MEKQIKGLTIAVVVLTWMLAIVSIASVITVASLDVKCECHNNEEVMKAIQEGNTTTYVVSK